jgi:DNA repair exonuclease SbcCD ATPase subunit
MAVQRNTQKYKEWRTLCDRAREVFHRDNLPNKVANSFLGAINARLSKYLELFGVPYAVKINNALEIVCSFGSTEVPAERLSGGQKVELSLAFRFSIYDLFSQDLGLLVLDEPTVYLDNDRIESVAKLMTNVRSYSRSAGMQVIIVTHEARLAEICDLVVRLG